MGGTRQNHWLVDVGTIVLFSIVTTKLLVHLYANRNYGYFIDELTSLPFFGTTGKYPPQRPQRRSHAAFVF
jgi:hypothetical protein